MAVELATAYITIIPSAKGMAGNLASELGGPAAKAGVDAGEKAGRGFAEKFKDHAAKAGLAGSAALTAGFVKDLSIDKGTDKLAAQLGLTAEQSKQAGTLAGKLYTGAYGDNLGQVNDAVAAVSKNISSLTTSNAADMERLTTKTLNLASAFDQDLGATTAAVGQLVKTGLAKNADEAFDIITKGLQSGADKAGDLLDTYSEYGTQFRKLGLDGATATGLLSQGLKAGARDADIVADTFKEFSIRAVDGSKLTGEGFAAVGLDAKMMAREIATGGPRATAALDLTLDRLRAIKDPVAQSAAAVALFGTQAEDMGAALFALDPSAAVAGLGEVAGAADRVDKTLGGNTASTIEKFTRTIETKFAGIAGALGPVGAALPALGGLTTTLDGLGPVLSKVGSGIATGAGKAKDLVVGLGSAAATSARFAASQAAALANVAKTTAALVAQKTAVVAQAVATKAAAVAQGIFNAVMALNPVVLIVIAIVALVAALVLAYQKVDWFRNFVDGAFRLIAGVVETVVGFIKDHWKLLLVILTGPIGIAVLLISKHWDTIKGFVTGAIDFVKRNWQTILAILTGPIGLAVLAITKNWDTIKAGFTAVKDWIGDRIGDVIAYFTGLKDSIFAIAHGIFDPVFNAWKAIVGGIIDMWNRIDFGIHVAVPDWVPGIGGKGFHVDDVFPDIPSLASGGIIPATPGGRIVRVAEAGRAEAIVPLDSIHGGFGLGGGSGPTFPIAVDARGMQRPEEVGDYVARNVGFLLSVAGVPVTA